MGWTWNWLALPGLLSLALATATALVLLLHEPSRSQNRRLALVLFLDAGFAAFASGLTFIMTEERHAFAMQMVAMFLMALLPFAYLRFLATVESPLARPLRSLSARILIPVLALVGLTWTLMNPRVVVTEMVEPPYATWDAEYGVALEVYIVLLMTTLIFGLAVCISALVTAKTEVARGRARAYVLAFGIRDGLFLILVAILTNLEYWISRAPWFPIVFSQAIPLVFIPFLAYGILRHQLFDIDLKLKFAIKGSTLAAAFVAAFFIVDQLVQALAGQLFGAIAGAVAAGALLFFLQPLQRLSSRVADAAMPHVKPTTDYVAFKKLEVYKAAVESTAEGGVSLKERRTLDVLRDRLGIRAADARAVERELEVS